MFRRLTIALALLTSLSLVVTHAYRGYAATGGGQVDDTAPEIGPGTADGSTYDSSIEVVAANTYAQTSVTPTGSPSPGPICSYNAFFEGRNVFKDDGDGVVEDGEFSSSYRVAGSRPTRYVDGPGEGIEMYAIERCPPGGDATGSGWVPSAQSVDIGALIDTALERLRANVRVPALNMSPAPDVGVAVQLGIWFAVNDPGQLNVVAQAGPVWAAASAALSGMTWDLGNGESIECAGLGTPYPEGSNQIEQGPCGYTYRAFADVGVRQVTATAHFNVQLTTSTGRNEMLDPVSANYTFDYRVYEIITTGVG